MVVLRKRTKIAVRNYRAKQAYERMSPEQKIEFYVKTLPPFSLVGMFLGQQSTLKHISGEYMNKL